ncbi:hypothetical protein LXL04_027654 [Taraxacum kok-saghyz]
MSGSQSTSEEEGVRNFMIVELHYNGMFAPKPFAYLNDEVITIRGVDFDALNLLEFRDVLSNVVKGPCEDVYYCSKKDTLAEGIRRINNYADYTDFQVAGYDNPPDYRVDLYIDQNGEPVLDWADDEAPEDNEDSDLEWVQDDDDDDKDSEKSYEAPMEHEVDEEVPTFNKTTVDPFLRKLCANVTDNRNHADSDDEDNNAGDQSFVYPVHDENQEWYKMKPELVKNGYDLWYERNDCKKLLVRCGKGKKNKNGYACPFRLWASWMNNEHTFQHFMNEILQNPKMSIRKLKTELVLVNAATGRDANNHMYPISWAVVAIESTETWLWFLELLMDDLGLGSEHGLTLMSDQHKGLLEAVKERVPAAEHRQCARHIYANLRKRFKSEEYAAGSTTQQRYQHWMDEIKKLEPEAFDQLMEKEPKTWCKAFFEVDRACDAFENGVSESFNFAIDEIRTLPLLTMLEEIRIYVMERLYNSKKKGECWDLDICPSIRLKLEKFKLKQRFWQVYASGYEQFEVKNGYDGYVVNLNNRTCGCRAWQLTGIPCVHGVAAISYLNRNHEEYVAEWFTTAMFAKSYMYTIKPLNGSEMWPEVEYTKPLPPKKGDIVEPTVAPEVGPLFGEESDIKLDVEPDDPPVIQPTVEAQEDTVDPAVQPDEELVVQAQEEVMREGRAEEEHVVAAAVGVRTRKHSERIVKLKLAKKLGGEGSNA